jgi:uncharacterized repeat protein (TIGR01451 family)
MSHFALRCRPFAIVFALFILIVSLLSAVDRKLERVLNAAVSVPAAAGVAAPSASSSRVAKDYGKLPISFEVNQGQTDKSVQFLARGAGYTLFLTPVEAVLSLHTPQANAGKPAGAVVPRTLRRTPKQLPAATPASTVRLHLIGSNTTAEATGVDPLPGKSNYLMGNDPAKWHTDVSTYAKVSYRNVYPGIDLIYYGNQEGRLEHDFVVAPGADPTAIAIGLRDGDAVVPDGDGGLTLHTKTGDLTLRRPVAYQTIGDQQKAVPAGYSLAGNQIRFHLGSYDRNTSLVIDPVIQYSAIFGGTNIEYPAAFAIDDSGNAYITGETQSVNFPVAGTGASCAGNGGDGTEMTFVSKINAAGTALLYSSYLQCGLSWGTAIAVDGAGRAHILETINANASYLTVLSPAGDSKHYETGLPGIGTAIALDSAANAYVAGYWQGMFVTKFDRLGVPVYYNNFSSTGYPSAIAVDASGAVYITGSGYDPGFPVAKNAYQTTCAAVQGWGCGVVTKLSPSGQSIVYSTYFGHPAISLGIFAVGIAVDSSGNAYVAGSTGPGFPTTSQAFQKTYGGNSDGFVIKLNASGTGLIWSTYLGGSGVDLIKGLALDQYRQVYVTGYTNSPNFPLKSSAQSHTTGSYQAFVTTLSGSLGSIVYYSTYLGTYICGNANLHLAVDKALNVYVGGPTCGGIKPTPGSLNIGTAANPGGGDEDVFISKLTIMDDMVLGLSASSTSVVQGGNLTYTIAVTSAGPDFGVNVRVSDTLPAGTTLVSYDAGGGTCTAPSPGSPGTLNCTLPQLNKGATWNVNLTVKVNAAAGTTLSNTAATISNMQDFVISNNSATITTRVY